MSASSFPRTPVGRVSLPRLIIGTNWFRGYSHVSRAKDKFIKQYQTPERIAEVLRVYLDSGVDALMGGDLEGGMAEAITRAEQAAGRRMLRILTPHFNLRPGGPPDLEPERVFDRCREMGAVICMPHQLVTDALLDRRDKVIRDLDRYTRMIRDRGMLPGLSTHMPETVPYADAQNADVETYIQIYNAAGFLMQVETDWVMRIIAQAAKPVIAIKPLAGGRLMPVVGLAFVWSTIRERDLVCAGAMTADEARELMDISLDLLARRTPGYALQSTRSKTSLGAGAAGSGEGTAAGSAASVPGPGVREAPSGDAP